jgi:hypothetical protein
MTIAEMLLLIAGGTGIYFLLRPLQRWLELHLARMFSGRTPRYRPRIIDVTDFESDESRRKDDHRT